MSRHNEQKRQKIFKYLDSLQIKHETVMHPAAHTVEEELAHVQGLLTANNACLAKNLFLKEKKSGGLILLTAHCETIVDLKSFAKKINVGTSNLRFADGNLLEPTLGVIPGAVTPLGLLNDAQNQNVTVYFDAKLFDYQHVIVHP